MNRYVQTVLLFFFISAPVLCQENDSVEVFQSYDSIYRSFESDLRLADTLMVVADSGLMEEPEMIRMGSQALMYALVLPGLGQAYNHKYYKMPIVWAALGVSGYAIVYNTKQYQQASINYALDNTDLNERYLLGWRRNMELSYIAFIAVYALQVLDAYVDALLYNWDVNEDLSLRVSPALQPLMAPSSGTGYSYGLTCSFNIRGR